MKTYIATFIRHNPQTGNHEVTRIIEAKTLASAKKQARNIEKACIYGSMSFINIEEKTIITKEETKMENYNKEALYKMTGPALIKIAESLGVAVKYNRSKGQLTEPKAAVIEKILNFESAEKTDATTADPIEATEDKAPIPASKAKCEVKAAPKKSNLKLNEITYKGETKSIRVWAQELNMPWATLYDRINRNGWTVEEAIEIPLGQRRPR